MTQRIAIYPTSANPPTLGHADILVRTARYFDYVYWAAAINPEKTYYFTEEQRLLMMSEYIQHHQLKNVSAEAFMNCLLYTSPSPRDVEESRMPSSA